MSTFLTATWRHLIMAQYEVLPDTLTPFLPAGVTLDVFRDRAYVSLVGFLFDDVRLKGLPIPFHTRFEEVNLRFYVLRTDSDGTTRRGVVFIREFVPRAAITLIANTFYEEPYATLPTRHTIAITPEALNVSYGWKHQSRWHNLAVEAANMPQVIALNSEEDFITEHYWGFTKRSKGTTSQYEVQHPHWRTFPILNHAVNVDFAALYGPAFAPLNTQQPSSVLLAEGSGISVSSGSRLLT